MSKDSIMAYCYFDLDTGHPLRTKKGSTKISYIRPTKDKITAMEYSHNARVVVKKIRIEWENE